MTATKPIYHSGSQRGAVLAIGLLMLLVLTVVGVGAMKSSVLDERVAANSQFRMLAFQAAESALAEHAKPEAIDTFVRTGLADVAQTTYQMNASTEAASARDVEVNVTIARDLDVTAKGASLNVGGQRMMVKVYRFTAIATVADTRASATHHMALGRLEPFIEGQE